MSLRVAVVNDWVGRGLAPEGGMSIAVASLQQWPEGVSLACAVLGVGFCCTLVWRQKV